MLTWRVDVTCYVLYMRKEGEKIPMQASIFRATVVPMLLVGGGSCY